MKDRLEETVFGICLGVVVVLLVLMCSGHAFKLGYEDGYEDATRGLPSEYESEELEEQA